MSLYVWIGALLIGLSLGLLGSGGSILTVPVLVYLAGEPDKIAIAESLAIVALIALAGSFPYALQRQIHWRSVLWFGLPGMAGTYGGAFLSQYLSGPAQLVLFAGVMLLAAGMMVRGGTLAAPDTPPERSPWRILPEGLLVGVLTGLVGVGGGFLIVPALVLLGGLPMRLAVGTSLFIIALKSLTGFYKYVEVLAQAELSVNWPLIALFTALGVVGSWAGNRLNRHIPQAKLRKGFAVFLVAMAVFILWQNAGRLGS